MSKSTPVAAIANLPPRANARGKRPWHDGDELAMFMAQVAMGADKDQTLRAIAEAKRPGPSLVIAYAACINHGLKAGMRCSQRVSETGG
jgi:pyruvate-ferredoxin/flavodoxin oxidoreductase